MKHPSRLQLFISILLIGLVATLGLLALLTEFHEQISDPWLRTADAAIANYLHQRSTPWLTGFMFTLSVIGSWKVMFPVVALLFVWLLIRRSRGDGLILVAAVAGASIINILLKLLFQRPRPSPLWALAHETSFSFPSGHSVTAMAFYGTVAFLLWRRVESRVARAAIVITTILLILGTGASRVYLGVHYPSDVAAGFLVGATWVATVVLAARQLRSAKDPSVSHS